MTKKSTLDRAPEAAPALRSRTALVVFVVAAAALTWLDLATKQWALDELSTARAASAATVCTPDADGRIAYQRFVGAPVVLIEGYLEFRYAENCGAAFGIMRDAPLNARRGVFGVAAIVASLALFWMFAKGRGGALFAWSAPMIVAGALGNLFDRVRLGYVVDFIRFHLEDGWEYPTFNVADIYITVGVVFLVLDGFREEHRAKVAAASKAAAATATAPTGD